MPDLAASAMNALAHACEARWNANGNPITDAIAERGARRLCDGLVPEQPDRDALALGAVEAAYAFGLVGTGVHHIVCQTIVRRLATPARRDERRDPPPRLRADGDARARGDRRARSRRSAATPAAPCARPRRAPGATRLRELGHTLDEYRALVPAMLARPDLARTPGVGEHDLAR